MSNLELDFDKYFFRLLDIFRVKLKRIFTKLGLRNKQSCRYCGRDQWIIWSVKSELWYKLPEKYHNRCLCLECFSYLYGKGLSLKDFDIMEF